MRLSRLIGTSVLSHQEGAEQEVVEPPKSFQHVVKLQVLIR
jgi:hypothetical protein